MGPLLPIYAAVAATMFNLNCTGLESTESIEHGKTAHSFSTVFRINLTDGIPSGNPVKGACSTTQLIAHVDDDRVGVHLKMERTGSGPGARYHRLSFARYGAKSNDRLSELRFDYPDRDHIYFYRREAQCVEAPFTGFPEGIPSS
jgi:hypothetical protein